MKMSLSRSPLQSCCTESTIGSQVDSFSAAIVVDLKTVKLES